MKTLLNKVKKLPYIEGRVIKLPMLNEEEESDELIFINKFNGK